MRDRNQKDSPPTEARLSSAQYSNALLDHFITYKSALRPFIKDLHPNFLLSFLLFRWTIASSIPAIRATRS